jgi:hypothetical protein
MAKGFKEAVNHFTGVFLRIGGDEVADKVERLLLDTNVVALGGKTGVLLVRFDLLEAVANVSRAGVAR